MSLNPINFHLATCLSLHELQTHGIDKDLGLSSLPIYTDSLFSVCYMRESITYIDGRGTINPAKYIVIRVPKNEIDMPLDTPVVKSYTVVAAMLINQEGYSARKELKGYKFEYLASSDYKTYELIKRLDPAFHRD